MRGVRKAMGGGVDALFNNSHVLERLDNETKALMQIHILSIHRIKANEEQPRKRFIDDTLKELAQSIEEHGILQPLVVKPSSDTAGMYTIIAGERRYRAACEVGLKELPVIIHEVGVKEAFILALTENMQRESLTPLEEANALYALKENFGFTQEDLARTLGKRRSSIANLLRLIHLCDIAQEALEENTLSLGHAKVLLGIADIEEQHRLTDMVLTHNLSVRQTEELIEKYKDTSIEEGRTKRRKMPCPEHMQEIADRIGTRFSTKVRIKGTEQKGSIVIRYSSREMLDVLLTMLERE